MLCLIGEAFDDETEEICGAVMNVRMKGDKIAMWTRDATNVDSNMKIGSAHSMLFCSNFCITWRSRITSIFNMLAEFARVVQHCLVQKY